MLIADRWPARYDHGAGTVDSSDRKRMHRSGGLRVVLDLDLVVGDVPLPRRPGDASRSPLAMQVLRVFEKLQLKMVNARHHARGVLVVDGVRVLALHVSLGRQDLSESVARRLRASLHLTAAEFKRLLGCRMSRDEYVAILRTKSVIGPSTGVGVDRIQKDEKRIFRPTCFLSYSALDEDFADKLYTDLQEAGIDCWFAPHDLSIGDDIRQVIAEEIRDRETVILVLSRNSIDSEWVEAEVREALAQERERGSKVLFPIRIDDAVFDPGGGWYRSIRRRLIGDFRSWNDHDRYSVGLTRLLRDLRTRSPRRIGANKGMHPSDGIGDGK
jgi:hypothetical protein